MGRYRQMRVPHVRGHRAGRPLPIYPQGTRISYPRLRLQFALIAGLSLLTTLIIPVAASAAPRVATIEVSSTTTGWAQTPLSLKQGQTYAIKASGSWTVDYRNFPKVGPAGYDSATDSTIYQGCKVIPVPYATLLGSIGGGPAFVVGTGGDFTASTDGALSLRINDADACLQDNAGSVFTEVRPGSTGAPQSINLSKTALTVDTVATVTVHATVTPTGNGGQERVNSISIDGSLTGPVCFGFIGTGNDRVISDGKLVFSQGHGPLLLYGPSVGGVEKSATIYTGGNRPIFVTAGHAAIFVTFTIDVSRPKPSCTDQDQEQVTVQLNVPSIVSN
jgi:hypothetical protein